MDQGSDDVSPVECQPKHVVGDYISTMQSQRQANRQILHRVYELSDTRTMIFDEVKTLVRNLDELIRQVTDHTDKLDLPGRLKTRLGELQHTVEILRSDPLASLQANTDRVVDMEHELVESLYHSAKFMDLFFESHSGNLSDNPCLGESPTARDAYVDIDKDVLEESAGGCQYLSSIGDVDLVKEELSDLYSERAQLLAEQQFRTPLGLSLPKHDLEFLDSVDKMEQALGEKLELAELVLEGSKQLLDDTDALRVFNETSAFEPNDMPADLNLAGTSPFSSWLISKSIDHHLQNVLCNRLRECSIKPFDHLRGAAGSPIHPANFINAWLLDSLRCEPSWMKDFVGLLDKEKVEGNLKDLNRYFLETWFNDYSELDFDQHCNAADKLSMEADRPDSEDVEQRSMTAAPIPSNPIPLMHLGPSVTSADVAAQFMRVRGIPQPELPET